MEQVPPLLAAEPSPPLLPAPVKSSRRWFCLLLSFCLALFLLDGVASFVDDALILFFHVHALSLLRGLISIAATFMAVGVYALIGITPMVPKRLFLPIPMSLLVSMLAIFTLAIFWRHRIEEIAFGISSCELLLGLLLVYAARRQNFPQGNSRMGLQNQDASPGSAAVPAASLQDSIATCRRDAGAPRGGPFSWPLVTVEQLGARGFSWKHVSAFVLGNVFVLLPLVAGYLFFCSARAVNHFSEGFVTLHPNGFTVQVRKYVRDDGKVIELFPMAHIADESFYGQVSQAFPTNSVILMEGVSDEQNLLTNKISYKRMANSLGLSEQKATFAPSRGDVVPADVDVGQFSKNTIDFLNLVMLFHSKGATPENLSKLMQFSPPPQFEEQLFDDLLTKRNEHLLGEIRSQLLVSDAIMVPWGAAHMPGLAREIQKSGFHLSETKEFFVIRFGHSGKSEPRR